MALLPFMGRQDDSRRGWGRIDAVARGTFLAAVRRGVRLEEAAEVAGRSLSGFYRARRRDAGFREQWGAAMEASAGAYRVAPNGRRRLQLRKMRQVSFTEARRQTFLDHFAGTCDFQAAADAACVDRSTVYKHLRRDGAFREQAQAALEHGYVRLEAEALRQRLEAQRAFREGAAPSGEMAAEFERIMELLRRWDRGGGKPGLRTVPHGRQQSVPFDEAVDALARRLRALDIPIRGMGEG